MNGKGTNRRPVMTADGALAEAEAETLRQALAVLPRVTAPADLWLRVQRRIRAEALERRRRRARIRRLVPVVAPLAAAALLVLAVCIIKGTESPPLPPPQEGAWEVTRVEALVLEHAQLANEPFVGGDDLLVAEYAFPADVIRTSSHSAERAVRNAQ